MYVEMWESSRTPLLGVVSESLTAGCPIIGHMANRYNQIINKYVLNLIISNKRATKNYLSFGNTKIGIADGETP